MNGQRGMSTVGAVLLAATAGLLTATLMMDWMVVDVHVVEEDTPIHIKLPFPLLVADIATGFVPDQVFEEAQIPPEARAQKELVVETIRALLDSPDAEFVKVRTEDATVDISKDGDTLRIAVDADDAVVRCNVPIDGILKALEDWDWETVDPQIAFDILRAAENGDLVTVATEDGVRVAIKMW
jgi:hypothetical protein